MTEELLTTGEVADRFQVGTGAVRHWVAKGWIHAHRLPSGRLRFKAAEVDAALEEMDRTGLTPAARSVAS